MRLFSQDELSKALNINNTAIDRLVSLGEIPYKRIISSEGEIIKFCPDTVARWIKKGIDLSMDDKKFIERYKKRMEKNSPEAMRELKNFSSQFNDPIEPKRYYLEPVKNKKMGRVYYVKYLNDGILVRSKWCTHTNNYDLAVKFALENRDRLLKAYYKRKADKKPYYELYSILKNYYAENSPYLQFDIDHGRDIGENARVTYHNFIVKQFIPYLRKEKVKELKEIDTPLLYNFQQYLKKEIKKGDKIIKKSIKPQTINHYISYISMIFDHLIIKKFITNNPCRELKSLTIRKNDLKITGCYEVNKLKGVFNRKWKDELSYLLSLLMYTTDMRNSEIERIQVRDLFIIDKFHFLNISESKSKNGIRIVPVHDFVYRKLMAYVRKNKIENYIFKKPTRKKLGSKIYRKAYLELAEYTGYSVDQIEAENIKFYSGRHFWKTLMNSENLGDIEEYFMGHKVSADVAKRYNHKDKQGKKKLLDKTKKVFDILDKKIFKF